VAARLEDLTVESLRRRGTEKWSTHGPEVLAAWVAEMDFPTAPAVKQAAAEAVEREAFGYPLADARTELPSATAEWLSARFGWEVDPARVHLLPDVLKGVQLAVEHFTPDRSAIALPTPAYMPFFEIPRVTRRPVVEIPMGRELPLDGIEAALAGGAGCVILCNPCNPLGLSYSREELEELAAVVERHRARVVADEIHAPLTYPGSSHVPYASVSPAAAGHSITLVSASKAWNLPGLKCAQAVITNAVDEERWGSLSELDTHGASTVGIAASVAAYRHGRGWLDEVVAYLDANRRLLAELLADRLPAVAYRPPDATYLAWLDCRGLELGEEPAGFFLREARVAASPGSIFRGHGPGHIRFNFATSSSLMTAMVEAMAQAVSRPRGRRPT